MKRLFSVLLCSIIITNVWSQDVIGSAGRLDTAQGVSVDWNVGEVIIETGELTNHAVTQGFEQPNYIVSSIEHDFVVEVDMKVYPNPASEQITIEFSEEVSFPWTLNILDDRGRLVRSESIESQRQEISLTDLAPSTYFILVESADKKNYEKLSLIISH